MNCKKKESNQVKKINRKKIAVKYLMNINIYISGTFQSNKEYLIRFILYLKILYICFRASVLFIYLCYFKFKCSFLILFHFLKCTVILMNGFKFFIVYGIYKDEITFRNLKNILMQFQMINVFSIGLISFIKLWKCDKVTYFKQIFNLLIFCIKLYLLRKNISFSLKFAFIQIHWCRRFYQYLPLFSCNVFAKLIISWHSFS